MTREALDVEESHCLSFKGVFLPLNTNYNTNTGYAITINTHLQFPFRKAVIISHSSPLCG